MSGRPSPLLAGPLDGSEPVWVLQGGRWRSTTSGAIVGLAGASLTALGQRIDALGATVAAQAARLAALEGRPEEVAHFTAFAKLPAIAAGAGVDLPLTGLVPARTGDVLRKDEDIAVSCATALPAGVTPSNTRVTADGTVVVRLTALALIQAGTAALTWKIVAQR